jgi:hypothetical protein
MAVALQPALDYRCALINLRLGRIPHLPPTLTLHASLLWRFGGGGPCPFFQHMPRFR